MSNARRLRLLVFAGALPVLILAGCDSGIDPECLEVEAACEQDDECCSGSCVDSVCISAEG